jgi:branched-chain amino acid transport system ATP-binding protein
MLKVERIHAFYGRIQALRDLSLHVGEGEIVAVIGPNGAGKSTLLNAISGLVPVRHGRILFEGRSVAGLGADRIVHLGISQVPERRQIFSSMSVYDNLLLGAYHRYNRDGRRAVERDLEYIFEVFPRLRERIRQAAGTLSGGEQQMLALGRGWMAKPRLLLMDEPSLGLAPLMAREIFRVSVALRAQGTTILLVEQNAHAALAAADRAYVMESGKMVLEGKASALAVDPRVQSAYLGKVEKPAL